MRQSRSRYVSDANRSLKEAEHGQYESGTKAVAVLQDDVDMRKTMSNCMCSS